MQVWRAAAIPKHWLNCITGAKDVSKTTVSHYVQHVLNLADKSQVCSCHFRLSVALVPVHITLTAVSGFAMGSLMAEIFTVVVVWDGNPTIMKIEQGWKQISANIALYLSLWQLSKSTPKKYVHKSQTWLFAQWSIIPIQLMTKWKNVCPEPFMKKLGKSGLSPDFCLTIQ